MKNLILIVILVLAEIAPAQSQSLPANFYKHYTGTIAGQKVSAELWSVDDRIEGRYMYETYHDPLLLSILSEDTATHIIRLGEEVDANRSAQKYPVWQIRISDGILSGKWLSADRSKTYPIHLKEAYPEGVTRFTYGYFYREIPAVPRQPASDSYGITFIYPKALGTGAEVRWLNRQIKAMLGLNRSLSFEAGIEVQYQKQAADYREVTRQATSSGDAYMRNWYSVMQVNIAYNENGYVQLRAFEEEFLGGAHPNHREANVMYDLKNKRTMQLSDITTIDSTQLQTLIEAQFRKDFKLSPTDSLNTILFENHLSPNTNISFTHKGIRFTYIPYEVAAYAVGFIYVFLPYEQLKGTLVPEFKKRMHLNDGLHD